MTTTPRLWLDVTVALDQADTGLANWWACPPEDYLDFGPYNQALITIKARVLQLDATNAPGVFLDVERTHIQGPNDDRFGSALGTTLDLDVNVLTTAHIVLGREDTANLDAGGVGRITLTQTENIGDDGAMVELQAWVALARYERSSGRSRGVPSRVAMPAGGSVRR